METNPVSSYMFARALWFWGSHKAQVLNIKTPLTAYNAMYPSAPIKVGRLSQYTPLHSAACVLIRDIVSKWGRGYSEFDCHALIWALSNIDYSVQASIIDLYTTFSTYEDYMKDTQTSLDTIVVDRLKMALANLEQALVNKDPMMPRHLAASHQVLVAYPESTALLDDADIANLISGAEIHSNIEVVKASVAKPRSRKAPASADDL